MENFKTIETQEALDAVVKDRLERERNKVKTEYEALIAEKDQELNALKAEREESQVRLEEADKGLKEIEQLRARVSGYETAEKKQKIALECGLPLNLAGRIQGDDDASMKADAQQLAEIFQGPKEPVLPLKSSEPIQVDSKEGAYRNLLEGLTVEGD